jgi:outer membrane protein assembly factor BamB
MRGPTTQLSWLTSTAVPLLLAGRLVAAPTPLGHPAFLPSPEHPVGFRGDWTGRYPGATPPVEWSFAHNVLWKTPVGNGEASVIVVGDRLVVLSDGTRLTCLRKSDGKLLWQRDHHARADVAEESKAFKLEEYVILHHRARPLLAQANQAQREKDNLEREATRTGKQADAARLAVLQQEADAAARKAAVHTRGQNELGLDEKETPGAITYAIATPCSDGRLVWAFLPLGEVVCYDLEGNRRWQRLLGERRAGGGWGGAQVGPSPLLADGKVVVHYDKFYGLDAATGAILWQTPTRGLPIPSPIPGRRGDAWYAMMGNGQILRLADGRIVFDPPWKQTSTVQSPIFYDDVFCWIGAAVRLPPTPDRKPSEAWSMAPKDLEQVDAMRPDTLEGPKPMLGWHGYSCPVYDEGLVYYQAEHRRFSAFEGRTGKLAFTTTFPCNGEIYPGAVLAGDHLFLANRRGRMLMVAKGTAAKHRIVAVNDLPVELGGNMPVFDGARFYLRMTPQRGKGIPDLGGGDSGILFCIGDPLAGAAGGPPPADPAALLKQLDDPDDTVAFGAARALRVAGERASSLLGELAKRLEGSDARQCRMALLGARALGPAAASAAPKVIPFLWAVAYPGATLQLDLHRAARDAIRAIGPGTVPALVAALKTSSREWGWQTHGATSICALLVEFADQAKASAGPLLEVLRTGSHIEMRAALGALRALDATALKEKGPAVLAARAGEARPTGEKRTALELLGEMGPDAASAQSVVEAATNDANAAIAKAAIDARAKISGK